ncbi:hypothetical protein [Conexibacter sp. SYSU D00693]|uniref:hypothetical protein n=1 Tax=Conexibacter sp. SYSU D00693 TaxID=2812560 RepID=UPI00196A9F61|nr:hypothetical protein [Conexibacter sp. SYSU D00693]
MAPATFAGAASATARKGRGGWDRDAVISAIQEWVATYGEPPRAADWNPSSAKWSGQLWRVERYRAGRADGSSWPALNSAKRPFGGSLGAAIRAAGFEPARPGPRRRTDVDVAQADRAQMDPEARAMLRAALASAREAEGRVARLEAALERERERAASAPPKVVRERVVDQAAVTRAQRRAAKADERAAAAVRDAREQVAGARMDAAEARAAAGRLAARLERAEATIGTLRGERRELAAEAARLGDRLVAAQRLLDAAREAARSQTARVEVVTVREEAPEAAELRDALAEAARCRRVAEAAELRAARAERELRETVALVRGEARRLTPAELADLRASGPAGPAVLARALKALASVRASGGTADLRAALRAVAEAAVTWQERL